MTKIKVTGCKDCPLHEDCFVFGRCVESFTFDKSIKNNKITMLKTINKVSDITDIPGVSMWVEKEWTLDFKSYDNNDGTITYAKNGIDELSVSFRIDTTPSFKKTMKVSDILSMDLIYFFVHFPETEGEYEVNYEWLSEWYQD